MSQVYLILAHKNPEQLFRLVNRLSYLDTSFVIHIDNDCNINDFESLFTQKSDRVFFLKERKLTQWGSFAMIEATLAGLKFITQSIPNAERVTLLSGQDYPIKPAKQIYHFFLANKKKIFIQYEPVPCKYWTNGGRNRFPEFEKVSRQINLYGGSQWWSIPIHIVLTLLSELDNYTDFMLYYKLVAVPDESFFQTFFLNSDNEEIVNNIVNDNLRLISWFPPYIHPRVLLTRDLAKLTKSNKFFARKFDMGMDSHILDKIDDTLLNTPQNRLYRKLSKYASPCNTQAILMLSNKASVKIPFGKLQNELPYNSKACLLYHLNGSEKYEHSCTADPIFTFDNSVLHTLGFHPIENKLVPGNNHFPLFSFFRSYPDYDYYWVIEDDVYFNGNWKDFFNSFSPDRVVADLVSSHIRFISPTVKSFRENCLRKANEPSKILKAQLTSFNPIYRLSKEALSYLDFKMRDGWMGHHGTLIPSLLYEAGFALLDLGGSGRFCFAGNKNKYYKDTLCTIEDRAQHSSMRHKPAIMPEELSEKILYHPLKVMS